eukprot:m.80925 g.80925  ORF g.80925 m.80925 type:complete len:954 (-) comp8638_c2_seq2:1265-4126(-)
MPLHQHLLGEEVPTSPQQLQQQQLQQQLDETPAEELHQQVEDNFDHPSKRAKRASQYTIEDLRNRLGPLQILELTLQSISSLPSEPPAHIVSVSSASKIPPSRAGTGSGRNQATIDTEIRTDLAENTLAPALPEVAHEVFVQQQLTTPVVLKKAVRQEKFVLKPQPLSLETRKKMACDAAMRVMQKSTQHAYGRTRRRFFVVLAQMLASQPESEETSLCEDEMSNQILEYAFKEFAQFQEFLNLWLYTEWIVGDRGELGQSDSEDDGNTTEMLPVVKAEENLMAQKDEEFSNTDEKAQNGTSTDGIANAMDSKDDDVIVETAAVEKHEHHHSSGAGESTDVDMEALSPPPLPSDDENEDGADNASSPPPLSPASSGGSSPPPLPSDDDDDDNDGAEVNVMDGTEDDDLASVDVETLFQNATIESGEGVESAMLERYDAIGGKIVERLCASMLELHRESEEQKKEKAAATTTTIVSEHEDGTEGDASETNDDVDKEEDVMRASKALRSILTESPRVAVPMVNVVVKLLNENDGDIWQIEIAAELLVEMAKMRRDCRMVCVAALLDQVTAENKKKRNIAIRACGELADVLPPGIVESVVSFAVKKAGDAIIQEINGEEKSEAELLQAQKEHILQHADFLYFLSLHNIDRLRGFLKVYEKAPHEMQRAVLETLKVPIGVMRKNNGERFFSFLNSCPQSVDTFTKRALDIVCEKETSVGKHVSSLSLHCALALFKRSNNARFLTPVASDLKMEQIEKNLVALVSLPPNAIKAFVRRVLTTHIRGEKFLYLLHTLPVNDQNHHGIKVALEKCLERKDVFTQMSLQRALNKILAHKPLSIFALRTVIQAFTTYTGLKSFLISSMFKAIKDNKAWEAETLWSGYVIFLRRTAPESYEQLTAESDKNTLSLMFHSNNMELGKDLVQYAESVKPNPNLMELISSVSVEQQPKQPDQQQEEQQ